MKISWLAMLCILLIATQTVAEGDEAVWDAWRTCQQISAKDLMDPRAPTFSQFPAVPARIPAHPKLDLRDRDAREFRTRLRRGMAEGPNFANHYTIVGWGCGTNCVGFGVVNLVNGKTIWLSHALSNLDLANDVDSFLKGAHEDWVVLRFKENSRMLVLVGMLDEDREGAFYYVLKGERLVLVHSTIVKKNCGEPPR